MFSENTVSRESRSALLPNGKAAFFLQKERDSREKRESVRVPWQRGIDGGPRTKCLPSQRNVFSCRVRFLFSFASSTDERH